jgi:hypothetical protein
MVCMFGKKFPRMYPGCPRVGHNLENYQKKLFLKHPLSFSSGLFPQVTIGQINLSHDKFYKVKPHQKLL